MGIVKVSELISKPLICLGSAELIGTVGNIAFDSKLTKGILLKIYNDEDENDASVSFVELKKLKSADGDACTVAGRTSLLHEWNLDGQSYNNPMNCECYNQDGKRLGCVRDVILDGVKVVSVLVDKTEFSPAALISFSDRLLIFNDTDKPLKLSRPKPKVPAPARDARTVSLHGKAAPQKNNAPAQKESGTATSSGTAKNSGTATDSDTAKNSGTATSSDTAKNSDTVKITVQANAPAPTVTSSTTPTTASALTPSAEIKTTPTTALESGSQKIASKKRSNKKQSVEPKTEGLGANQAAEKLAEKAQNATGQTQNIAEPPVATQAEPPVATQAESPSEKQAEKEQAIAPQDDFYYTATVPTVPTLAVASATLTPNSTIIPVPTTAVPAPRIVDAAGDSNLNGAKGETLEFHDDLIVEQVSEITIKSNGRVKTYKTESVLEASKPQSLSPASKTEHISPASKTENIFGTNGEPATPEAINRRAAASKANTQTANTAETNSQAKINSRAETNSQNISMQFNERINAHSHATENGQATAAEAAQAAANGQPSGITLPHKMPPNGKVTPNPPESAQAPYSFLLGKRVNGEILDANGIVLAPHNTLVTPELITALKSAGKLVQLALHAE